MRELDSIQQPFQFTCYLSNRNRKVHLDKKVVKEQWKIFVCCSAFDHLEYSLTYRIRKREKKQESEREREGRVMHCLLYFKANYHI